MEAVGTWNWTIPIPIQTTCLPPLPSSSSPPHFYLLLPAAIIASRLAWLVYRQGHHSTKLFPLLSTSAVSSGLPIRSLASSSSSPQQPFPRSFSAPAGTPAGHSKGIYSALLRLIQSNRRECKSSSASSLPCFPFLPVSSMQRCELLLFGPTSSVLC